MSFRVMARTLLHLGAQLISSDAVALFELVKNSFDAGSSQVKIEVVVRIPHQIRLELVERVRSIERQAESLGSDSLKLLRVRGGRCRGPNRSGMRTPSRTVAPRRGLE